MKKYKAIIADLSEEVPRWVEALMQENLHKADLSATKHDIYLFYVTDDMPIKQVMLIAFGLFFKNGWGIEGTVSTFVEVEEKQ